MVSQMFKCTISMNHYQSLIFHVFRTILENIRLCHELLNVNMDLWWCQLGQVWLWVSNFDSCPFECYDLHPRTIIAPLEDCNSCDASLCNFQFQIHTENVMSHEVTKLSIWQTTMFYAHRKLWVLIFDLILILILALNMILFLILIFLLVFTLTHIPILILVIFHFIRYYSLNKMVDSLF